MKSAVHQAKTVYISYRFAQHVYVIGYTAKGGVFLHEEGVQMLNNVNARCIIRCSIKSFNE